MPCTTLQPCLHTASGTLVVFRDSLIPTHQSSGIASSGRGVEPNSKGRAPSEELAAQNNSLAMSPHPRVVCTARSVREQWRCDVSCEPTQTCVEIRCISSSHWSPIRSSCECLQRIDSTRSRCADLPLETPVCAHSIWLRPQGHPFGLPPYTSTSSSARAKQGLPQVARGSLLKCSAHSGVREIEIAARLSS